MSLQNAGHDKSVQVLGGEGEAASARQFVGDHLSSHWRSQKTGGRFITLSWKDRAAVMLGGPAADIALWAGSTGFVTSSFYNDSQKIKWLEDFNFKYPFSQYAGKSWPAAEKKALHKIPDSSEKWNKILAYSPFADELTLKLALEITNAYQLGKSNRTDLLAISLSSTDYIGHKFSYNSPEMRHQLKLLNHRIVAFEAALRRRLPGKKISFVLTADHGGTKTPQVAEAMQEKPAIIKETEFRKYFAQKMKPSHPYFDYALLFRSPHFYLHYEAIGDAHFSRKEILSDMQKFARENDRIFATLSVDQKLKIVRSNKFQKKDSLISDSELWELAKNCHFPERSPQLLVIPAPYVFLQYEKGVSIAGHGSPFNDDRHVPLFFWGDGIRPANKQSIVHTTRIAATLAEMAGFRYAPADGDVLPLDLN